MARWGRRLRRLGLAKPAADDPFGARIGDWFRDLDLLLMPTLAETPVPLGRWQGRGWLATTMGVAAWTLTVPWNLAGLPAASVPAGLSEDGLPLAVQLVARPGAEALLLQVLGQLEAARPWPAPGAGTPLADG
jgi:amidase